MDAIFINIGGFNIQITFDKYDPDLNYIKGRMQVDLFIYLRDFIVSKPKKTDFEIIFTTPTNFEVFQLKDKRQRQYTTLFQTVSPNKILTYSQISIYQFERVLKQAVFVLLSKHGGFGIHASAVVVGEGVYLFVGESGAGKSTAAELLSNNFLVLSDDLTFVRRVNKKYNVFQTPFYQKFWWLPKKRKFHHLRKIFFLKKSKEFSASAVTNKTIIRDKLLKQVFTLQEPSNDVFKESMTFIESFKNYYDLKFDKYEDHMVKLISSLK